MFSKLLSFFLPTEDNSVKKEEIDMLINTVSEGFQTHRDRFISLESEFTTTKNVLNSIDLRLSDIESKQKTDNSSAEVNASVLALQTQHIEHEKQMANSEQTITGVHNYSKDGFSEIMKHLSALNSRLASLESGQFLTRADLESYHNSARENLESKLTNISNELTKKTEEKINAIPVVKPTVIPKETVIEIEREIDVSQLTVLEKNILKSLVELKVKENVSSITITDLTTLLYPEGPVNSKRPTVSAYVSKLALSGFLRKERKNNSVFISIMKDKVVDYFTRENYSHLKRVI